MLRVLLVLALFTIVMMASCVQPAEEDSGPNTMGTIDVVDEATDTAATDAAVTDEAAAPEMPGEGEEVAPPAEGGEETAPPAEDGEGEADAEEGGGEEPATE